MNRLVAAAWAIARRDFVATVLSRSFLLFLLAPLAATGIGLLLGKVTDRPDEVRQPVVAIVTDPRTGEAIEAAHGRIVTGIGELALPKLRRVDPAEDVPAQTRQLLASQQDGVSAVFTGTLEKPELYAPPSSLGSLHQEMRIVVEDAQRVAALEGSGAATQELRTIATGQSAGNLTYVRRDVARGGQLLVFLLTLILAGMMLSNLVEEKSNKVVEVLAAAVPLDAIFLGKLIGMLGVSLVAVALWGSLAGFVLYFVENHLNVPVDPAVGWPVFGMLVPLYFAMNYMLLGSIFLGVGGQASNIREVQTLSMPITFIQVIVFMLAHTVATDPTSNMAIIAKLFPLSSPLAMIAQAAQSPTLWPHLLAIAWQLLWIVIIIRAAARMFRRAVLKSSPGEGFFDFLKRGRRA